MSRTARLQKTSDWLRSWVYDATDGKIYTCANHVEVFPDIPDIEKKCMEGKIICGWYTSDYGDVETRIATDTVSQEFADADSPIAKEAKEAALKYWYDNDLAEDYGNTYCPHCGEHVGDEDEHYHYCNNCGDYYYGCDYDDENYHNSDYCDRCGEHVDDIDEHDDEYHLTYRDLQGVYWIAPGSNKLYIGENSAEWIDPFGHKTNEDTSPKYIKSLIEKGVLKKIQDWHERLDSLSSWQESIPSAIIYSTDLHDDRVFAKIAREYLSNSFGDAADIASKSIQRFNNEFNDDDYQKGNSIYQGLATDPIDNEITPRKDNYWDLHNGEIGGSNDAPTEEMPQVEKPEEKSTWTENGYPNQPDDPRMLEIYRNRDSQEYRWSYDGTQLHMWRVFNRNTFGPSHFDMFGSHGYENHSQGRVYVSPDGKVGMLYWQITHPECERVLNEWCQKTFGKLPDYVYRAYGPYAGYPVSRWDFPVVEVSQLPLGGKDRWLDQGGSSIQTYPAKKKNDIKGAEYWGAPKSTPSTPLTFNPGKKNRRKRNRSRKYRNRSFGRR